MKKKITNELFFIATLLIILVEFSLFSCKSAKDVLYLQDIVANEPINFNFVEPKIQPGDILSIVVNSQNSELAAPFNLSIVSREQNLGKQYLQGYVVSSEGTINFPLLGEIVTQGLSTTELSYKIKREIEQSNFIKKPIVTVTYQNFRISVLGEVNNPGSFSVTGERVTLFDALGLAGDMTIYGRRDNVMVLREQNGQRQVFVQDLRSQEIFKSPCYYLAQNDVIIVNPNKTKIQMGGINQNNNVGVGVSLVGSAISITTFIMTISRNSQSN